MLENLEVVLVGCSKLFEIITKIQSIYHNFI